MPFTTLKKYIKRIEREYNIYMGILSDADGIIAGSTALDIYIRGARKMFLIAPTDIDIFLSESADLDRLVEEFESRGYKIETEKDNNKVEEYTFAGDIKKVVSLVRKRSIYDTARYVQLIVVEGDHRKFIVEKTDLSVTGLYYDCRDACMYAGPGVTKDIDRRVMRISRVYEDVMRGAWGAARKEKLLGRIAKYKDRGFRLID
jgi:hypothetical protein